MVCTCGSRSLKPAALQADTTHVHTSPLPPSASQGLRHLVLDEADRLLNMDFEQEIDQILKVIPKVRQRGHSDAQCWIMGCCGQVNDT